MFRRNVASIQADAGHLPLPDESVDLIVTSPPYWALRDYQDGGKSVSGQVGREGSPQAYLDAMWEITREWIRVLKPSGSIFVNMGDKYDNGTTSSRSSGWHLRRDEQGRTNTQRTSGGRPKSLMNIPARYAIGCTDDLGLIQRAEIVWDKINGLPESVRDRVRRAHELMFHFTKEEIYYQAVDRIREEHSPNGSARKGKTWDERKAGGEPMRYGDHGGGASGVGLTAMRGNPAGKLPGSVWTIPTFPLAVPRWMADEFEEAIWYDIPAEERFDYDHFAAFPPELVRRVIDGWSPAHVCKKCGQGRFPVTSVTYEQSQATNMGKYETLRPGAMSGDDVGGRLKPQEMPYGRANQIARIIGYACACTPYVDHPENRGKDWRGSDSGDRNVTGQRMGKDFQRPDGNGRTGDSPEMGGRWGSQEEYIKNEWGRAPVREYLLDAWEPAPTTPGVVLDPFGGTGTTAIVAAIMGRRGITTDLSWGYAGHLVPWRMNDRSQMRSLLGSKS